MRLAIVQAGLGAGGTERVVSLLAADRCRRGDEVHLFAFVGEQDKSYFALHPKVTVHRLVEDGASRLSKLGFVRSLRRVVVLRAEFKQLQPTLIVSFLTKINILCLLAAKNLGIRVIISERNNPKAQKKHAAWRLVSGIILRQADRLVMQTDAIVKTLPDTLRRKAHVIGNPCEVIGNPCEATDAYKDHGNEMFRLVAVGRLVEQKGFDTLIKAFAKITTEFPAWALTIFGEGPDRVLLQRQIDALDLEDRVKLAGITERPGEWARDASLFVLPSRYEGFPNVLIEAMAAGLPVVATDCDFGPSEIIEPGVSGLLVPVDDVAELASAMACLMRNNALRHKMGRSARKTIDRFSMQQIAEKWDSALTKF
ncbi:MULTISPECIES: glycosyltransferase family 4 protein [unclassified Mesorhizobium]|uniref:glycosyltransferase family 4 protein n=1 Tax=unclassified Mesorhizobium TaxID=325217 RepID=UPI00112911BA|nr:MULTISPECIES: glycosyltransferase family 4 protein [unclassified Mesorhizobium]TPI50679.1 glycosyltransferase family 4 protein [Mesorhizobium sp. B3-1-1]TPJ47141.1 glycosyltransferase family 4 protein [Mesorhizobium sp. B2-6-4]TPJ64951.1 glycosyltransferase family 4 protein [Mesorhizobium sp. B2-6-7]TPJ80851.1 glycosyltransferase family 4 protein [Mesorhizobium sp. B2-6-3]TPK02138.1 glycosyltransferase family 4 protein [Mesorhizobium sp. B2-5-10]